jgi:hypothetical protein
MLPRLLLLLVLVLLHAGQQCLLAVAGPTEPCTGDKGQASREHHKDDGSSKYFSLHISQQETYGLQLAPL